MHIVAGGARDTTDTTSPIISGASGTTNAGSNIIGDVKVVKVDHNETARHYMQKHPRTVTRDDEPNE
ncbi:hypothetical protein RvY_16787 [Ramazzottius varieornatus]|uniref:Uncharacterized protein n=1 Tax=Ramazzottius varieornatus TaxID=947166 RepID=A0A1D1W2C1_RAMVA|nr:hypothetical protein RvY_16787 [Ramazzottius varieornatus]